MIDLFIILLFIGWAIYSGLKSQGKASENLTEYFLAGRSLSGWKAGISMAATQFAADTPLLVTGLIATGGLYLNWRLWIYGIAFLMMGFLFGRTWRHSGVITDAEFTDLRYSGRESTLLRGFKALYYGTLFNCIVLAMVLMAAVRIAEVFLTWHLWLPPEVFEMAQGVWQLVNIEFGHSVTGLSPVVFNTNNFISITLLVLFTLCYSTTGGLRSVVATDMAQFAFAMVGTLIYAWIVIDRGGGLTQVLSTIRTHYPEQAEGILSFAPPGDELTLSFVALISVQWFFQINSDGTGYLAQRLMACRSDRDVKIAALVFAWSQVFLRSLIWVFIGIGLITLYPLPQQVGDIALFTAAREATFIQGIQQLLPAGVSGLMLVGMIGALASTVDTHLNWGASYWSNDIYRHILNGKILGREVPNREIIWVARLSNLLILALALYIMKHLGSIKRAWELSLFVGAGVGPVLVLRWLWERINIYSEMVAIFSSLVGAILFIFVWQDAPEFLKLIAIGSFSMLMSVLVTWFTPANRLAHLQAFFKRVRPVGFWGETARSLGEDPGPVRAQFYQSLAYSLSAALSLFAMLLGVGKLLLHEGGQNAFISITLILLSIAFSFHWLRGLKRS